MSKTLIVGDLHFGLNKDDDYKEYVNNTLDGIIYLSSNEHIKRVVFLGDLFDNRKALTHESIETCQTFVEAIKANVDEVVIIVGNHDCPNKYTNNRNSPSLIFKNDPKIKIVENEPYIFDDHVICVPWVNSENKESLESKSYRYKLVLGHFELAGFKMLKGVNSKHDSFNVDILSKAKKVMSGHFHSFSEAGNVTYLGAPCEMTWADCDEDKFICVYDVSTGKCDFHRNDNKYFLKLSITSEDDIKECSKITDEAEGRAVRVILECAKTIKIEKYLDSLRDKFSNLDIRDNHTLLGSFPDVKEVKCGTFLQMWQEYMTSEDVEDKEELNSLFEEYYNKAHGVLE